LPGQHILAQDVRHMPGGAGEAVNELDRVGSVTQDRAAS
jgi:hypothetical protein